jgi:hypothetical protein
MALTDTQKTAVRRHLGYNAASEALYPFVDTFFSVTRVLSDLPAATEDEVVTILGRLSALESALDGAPGRGMKVTHLGTIDLNPQEADRLWVEVRRWRRELSTILGLPRLNAGGIMVV